MTKKKKQKTEVLCVYCGRKLRGDRRIAAESYPNTATCSQCERTYNTLLRERERLVDR